MRQETFYMLDYRELEELVNDHLKPPVAYESVADNEWYNDSSYTFRISEDEYSEFDREATQEFLKTGEMPAYVAPQLLSELALRGVIPWGDYLIEVCW